MTILAKNQKDTVDFRLQKGQDNLKEANFLAEVGMFNAANSRLYIAACQLTAALCIAEAIRFSSLTDLMRKVEELRNSALLHSDKDTLLYFEKVGAQADFELGLPMSKSETESNINKAKVLAKKIAEILSVSSRLVSDIIGLLKQRDQHVHANRTALLPETDKLIAFIEQQFLLQPQAKQSYKAFVENTKDANAEATLEGVLAGALESAAAEHLSQLKNACTQAQLEMDKLEQAAVVQAEAKPDTAAERAIPQDELEEKVSTKIKECNDPIFVPWDFTDLAMVAVEHAANFTKAMHRPLKLVHIVKKSNEIPAAQKKMEPVEHRILEQFGVKAESIVREGVIFDDITKAADEEDAELVVMGTHGVKGMQKITGAWALKVIADTKAPFFIIQDKPIGTTIENIVVPMSPGRDLKKLLNEIRTFHEFYKPTFHLVRLKNYPTERLQKQAVANFVFFKSYLKQEGISYTDVELSNTKKIYEASLAHAQQIKAEFMMMMTAKDTSTADYIMGVEEQKVIINQSKMPILCVNPLHSKYSIRTNLSGY